MSQRKINGLPESCYAWPLICSELDSMRSALFDLVEGFYNQYDPTKSLDMTFITGLITEVHCMASQFKNRRKK